MLFLHAREDKYVRASISWIGDEDLIKRCAREAIVTLA